MNKRVKKKLRKRLGFRKYNNFRKYRIVKLIYDKYPDAEMIVVTTSRSGRSIKTIAVCSNIIPMKVNNTQLKYT